MWLVDVYILAGVCGTWVIYLVQFLWPELQTKQQGKGIIQTEKVCPKGTPSPPVSFFQKKLSPICFIGILFRYIWLYIQDNGLSPTLPATPVV